MKDWEPESDDHLHGAISDEKDVLQSPATASNDGEHHISPRQIAPSSGGHGEVLENTPTAASQGEPQSAQQ